jgi:hypothetical protein
MRLRFCLCLYFDVGRPTLVTDSSCLQTCRTAEQSWPDSLAPSLTSRFTHALELCFKRCYGSMTFWLGSGSTDPCLWLMDPDLWSDHAIFVIYLQDANKKLIQKILLLITFVDTFTSFFKDKKSKRIHKTVGIKVFLTIFACWTFSKQNPDPYLWRMDPDQDPGGPETCGSGGSWFGSGFGALVLRSRCRWIRTQNVLDPNSGPH